MFPEAHSFDYPEIRKKNKTKQNKKIKENKVRITTTN